MTREEAIGWLESLERLDKEQDVALEMAIEALRERKTGKWVLSPVDGQLHCSACNRLLWGVAIMALGGLPNACPWCGALLEVDE